MKVKKVGDYKKKTTLIWLLDVVNIYSDTSANEDNSFRNHIR